MSMLRWAVPAFLLFLLPVSVGAQRPTARGPIILPPWRIAYKVAPEYPALALEYRIQGTVRFTALIGKDGHVKHLTLVGGHPLLVAAAREAAWQWVYRPSKTSGKSVQMYAQIDILFVLDARGMPARNDDVSPDVAVAR